MLESSDVCIFIGSILQLKTYHSIVYSYIIIMVDHTNTAAPDFKDLRQELQSHFHDIKERLDRIDRTIASNPVGGTAQGKRHDLKRWTSLVATRFGIKLLRTVAKEAMPKNGRSKAQQD